MKMFRLILATGLFACSQTGMAACVPNTNSSVWSSKIVYLAGTADVQPSSAVPGAYDKAVETRITPQQAMQNSNRESVRNAFTGCNNQGNGPSIELIKAWHPDEDGYYRTIHITVRVRDTPDHPWNTCHVYAQSNQNLNQGGELTTTCAQGEDAHFDLYNIRHWRLTGANN